MRQGINLVASAHGGTVRLAIHYGPMSRKRRASIEGHTRQSIGELIGECGLNASHRCCVSLTSSVVEFNSLKKEELHPATALENALGEAA